MRRRIGLGAMVLVLGGCAREPAPRVVAPVSAAKSSGAPQSASEIAAASSRPAHWAAPVSLPGVPNLHRIDARFYRGAQPSAEGMQSLAKLGVKTVINLRSFNSDRDEIGTLPLRYEHITMKAWHPEDHEVVRFLRLVNDPDNHPIFVHCQHGADRTGTMTAIYRIAVQGWSKADAIDEMKNGGFGFHSIWSNLITYVEQLDVDEMKRRAGMP